MAATGDAQETLSRLGFIASIKDGERVDTTSLTIQGGTLIERASRALFSRGESRQTTFDFLKKTIDDALAMAERYSGPEGGETGQKIGAKLTKALANSSAGISALGVTYVSDRMFVARLATLADLLDMRLGSLTAPSSEAGEPPPPPPDARPRSRKGAALSH